MAWDTRPYNYGGGGGGGWSGNFIPSLDSFFGSNLIFIILLLNFLVFLLWQYEERRGRQGIEFMNNHFTVSQKNLREGRVWTLVNHIFSHRQLFHLLANSISLYFLGSGVLQSIGPQRFLGLYLTAGIIGGLAHVAYANISSGQWTLQRYRYVRRDPRKDAPGGLGASGAVNGVVAAFALMYPRTGLVIFPLPIPLPAIAVCAAYLAYDIYSSFNRRIGDNVGHVAHIGGAMIGAAYYFWRLRPYYKHRGGI